MAPPLSILHTQNTWAPPRALDSGPLMSVLAPADLFVLAIAAIGHDVGHPGFTNLFMANAAAPLSAVFDGKSPLEQMHCALLLRVMRAHGLGRLLDAGGRTRRLLCETVLATDMRVHEAFMQRFADLLARRGEVSLAYRRTTLCQAIIKCADISNPSRPYYISQHWATALLREWNAQAALERHHRLPPTVEASDHPLREAHSQMFFIPAFVKPLLDLVVRAVPEMHPYAAQCDLNLALWTARLAVLQAAGDASSRKKNIKAKPTPPKSPTADRECTPDEDYRGAFPLALPPSYFPPPDEGHGLRHGALFAWVPPPPPSTMSASPSEEDAESEASFAFSPSSRGSGSGSSTTSATSGSPAAGEGERDEMNGHGHGPRSRHESEMSQSQNGSSRANTPGGTMGGGSMMDGIGSGSGSGTAGIRAAAQRALRGSARHAHARQHRNSWSPAMRDEWGAGQMSAGVS
ncbi:hypothetical protein C8R47DRAFT_628063 [Mycena vitilis]|nr:hypothetical protein C8R47DRAFT_628063 [Mycena vitilis]